MRATVVSNRNQKKSWGRDVETATVEARTGRTAQASKDGLWMSGCLADCYESKALPWNENTQQGRDGRSGTRIKTGQLQLCTRLLSLKMPVLKPHSDCWVSLLKSTRALHLAQSSSSFRVSLENYCLSMLNLVNYCLGGLNSTQYSQRVNGASKL